jgi:acyl-homoserine lactone acylase PvdQ
MAAVTRIALIAAAACALIATPAASKTGPDGDYAAVALNILPPGQSGNLNMDRNTTDQLRLYDRLTPLFDGVRVRDLERSFKPAWFGLRGVGPGRVGRTPRRGVRIVRDRYGVAHVTGRTADDVAFGAGWATAEDRGLLLQLIRGPGRIAALDAPGIDPFALAFSPRQFVPSARTEAFLARQQALMRLTSKGREGLRRIDAYAAGINAYFRRQGTTIRPWTRNDTIAAAALIAAGFGRGGGDEVRRSMFLDALQRRLGSDRGGAVFDDLRQQHDAESPVSVAGRFAYGAAPESEAGNVVIDDGSFEPARSTAPLMQVRARSASNAVLISARRSMTGRPLFVAGPQVGYLYPESFTELDLHGGGIDARGISFPGTFGVVIGRGKDFAWSAQSSHSDLTDQYVETLCGGDDFHYVFKGECRAMEVFDAGVLTSGPGGREERVVFRTTLEHGPVIGYATVRGRRVAISSRRSTRGREILSAHAFADLNQNRVQSARDFFRVMNQSEFAFNWVYADEREIAFFSAGRLPARPRGIDLGLPTDGTGPFDWRGFLPLSAHARGINPPAGAIVAWNNRPARSYAAPDDTWSWGSVHRVDLLAQAVARRRKHSLASAVAAMNRAATQDFRVVRVLPVIAAVLRTGPAPSGRAERMLALLEEWRTRGASRLDRDRDGKIDHAGAAIIDAAWPKLADAVLRPVLGPLVDRLAALVPRDDRPNSQGSSFDVGWYGYVEKDLRTLLGRPVRSPFRNRYCGGGDLGTCRASLWAALDQAGAELAATEEADPAAWRADARRERIVFNPGILPATMRWTNRPTFQQVITFAGHRPRR